LAKLAETLVQCDGGATITNDIPMNSHTLTGITAADAAGKPVEYAQWQAAIAGLQWMVSVRARAAANVTLSAPGATVGGVSMSAGDRFLADQQSTVTQDGIYSWVAADEPAVRTSDMAAASSAANRAVFVEEGTYADIAFVCTNNSGSDVVGTDDLVFTQFTGAAAVNYETVGNITSVDAGDTASAGVNNTTARGDHQHAVSTAAPDAAAQLGADVGPGDSTSLARADHVHKANTAASGLATSGSIGTSQDIARADHQHARDVQNQEAIDTQAITNADTEMTDQLTNTPVNAASVKVFLNGLLQQQGSGKDYTISGKAITWLASSGTAVDMATSDVMVVHYIS
jgi:hypothetical protein